MEKKEIISSISAWGKGEIYLGVVGAVRTGKSTFIKKVIENLVIPNIDDEDLKKRCIDELPQSAPGKTIMTTEPKFVPSTGANIKIDEAAVNRMKKVWIANEVKLFDYVDSVASNVSDDLIRYGDIIPDKIDRIRKMNIDEMNDIISKIDFDNICYIKCLGKES